MSSDQPDTSIRRRWRRLAVFVGLPVVLLVAALVGAALFRHELAFAVLQYRLHAAGIESARLRIDRVTMRAVSLSDFRWGDALSFDRLTIGFSLRELLRGRIARVTLAGLRIDLTQTEAWAALSRGGDSAGRNFDPRILPRVEISDARLRLDSPVGAMGIAAEATLRPGRDGDLAVTLRATADGVPGRADVSLDGTIRSAASGEAVATALLKVTSSGPAAKGTTIDSLTLEAPMRLVAKPDKVSISVAEGGRFEVKGVQGFGSVPPIDFSAGLSGTLALVWPESGPDSGFAAEHALTIEPAPVTLAGGRTFRVVLGSVQSAGKLSAARAYRGAIEVESGRVTHGDKTAVMEGFAIRLTTEAGFAKPVAHVALAAIRDASAAPLPGSYSLVATVRQEGVGVAFGAGIGGLGVQKLVIVNGVHDLARQAGHAAFSIPDLSVGSDGLRLDAVLPVLAAVRKLAGSVGAAGRLDWRGDRLDGRATLRLAGIGGETDNSAVEGVGGTIVFDGLFPLRTAPDQILRIRRLGAGAVLTDAMVRFVLLPTGILRIDLADAAFADGRIVLAAPSIDLAAQKARATVTLENLQLEQILGLVELGDSHATGRVHGIIPLRLDGTTVAIDGGALAARGGGVLRLRSDRVKQALQSGGEQVAQMLLALENFSYERLSLAIEKSPSGEATVTLRTLGHNPAVLNGRKFQINVNLQTNLDTILDAVLQWYRLSGRALRDIVRP